MPDLRQTSDIDEQSQENPQTKGKLPHLSKKDLQGQFAEAHEVAYKSKMRQLLWDFSEQRRFENVGHGSIVI